MKKSYHSMVVPTALAAATRRAVRSGRFVSGEDTCTELHLTQFGLLGDAVNAIAP